LEVLSWIIFSGLCIDGGESRVNAINLSILKTGKAKAIRFSTLQAICEVLDCQPGEILEYMNEKEG